MKLKKAFLVVVFATIITCALAITSGVAQKSDEGQTDVLKTAVRNAVVTCYSVEGAYPHNIEYLEENYGISYNKERYVVVLTPFADNVMPQIRVLYKGVDGTR